MRTVEVAAKTREEAIDQALKRLKAERHEVNVEILDEGSSGIFGIGARNVKVRVSKEEEEEPKKPRPPRGRGRRKPAEDRERQGETRKESPPEAESEPRAEPRTRAKEERAAKPRAKPDMERGNEAAALLEEIIHRMGLEATVACGTTETGGIQLTVDSPDSAILIGRKGRNLNAMQYLINRMISREDGGERSERLVVDIEGYHDRRRASLEEMALGMAQRVKETGRRIRVKPLNPQERRVIHVTLQDDPDVRTFSVGDSTVRSVVIAPRNERPEEDRPRPRYRGRQPARARGPRDYSRSGGYGRRRGAQSSGENGRR
jgi:spoIIIJ-associated protein